MTDWTASAKVVDFSSLEGVPTPIELAKKTLDPIYFEWFCERTRVEEAVAAAIAEDRSRTAAVVNRIRVLVPALLRDLDRSLGGRKP